FLLVALAALAIYMVTISGVQQFTPVQSVGATQAWYAARSGLEAGAYQAVESGSCPATINLNLDGFTVTVTCSETTHTERGQTFQVYALEAFAERGSLGEAAHVARRATATATTAP
ncbi:hypothetical protein, partial [Natronospira sp.]